MGAYKDAPKRAARRLSARGTGVFTGSFAFPAPDRILDPCRPAYHPVGGQRVPYSGGLGRAAGALRARPPAVEPACRGSPQTGQAETRPPALRPDAHGEWSQDLPF